MKLSNTEYKNLKKNLPNLNQILTRKSESDYKKIIISVFERFMTREEYEVFDDIDEKTLSTRRDKSESSVRKLYELTDCYLWKYKKKPKVFINKPKNLNSLLNHCNIKNQTCDTGIEYDIIMPEFQSVYTGGEDWTNILWYRDKTKIQAILKIIENSGLHVID